ncbi:MAG: hypothetical protein ACTSPM_08475 [Candidatus Heimdallarchaeota archaeon]
MSDLIPIYYSDMADALYFFEYHGPLYKQIKWIERNKDVKELYKIIRQIKFPRLKLLLPWARTQAVLHDLTTPKSLTKYIQNNPPKGKFAEKWLAEIGKMTDIFQEILNMYQKKILTPEKRKELENNRKSIEKKYSQIWDKLKHETENTHGFTWKRKEPKICLLYPIDGRLSHKLKFADIAFIETSDIMIKNENAFLHEVIKLLNYTKTIFAWVKQDRRGIRAIAYELFTEMQTMLLIEKMFKKKPSFTAMIEKLDNLWIPYIRSETFFDDDELERVLQQSYTLILNAEFEPLYQLGELYAEMNIILLE